MTTVPHTAFAGPLLDERVVATIGRLRAEQERIHAERHEQGAPLYGEFTSPKEYLDIGYSLPAAPSELLYLLARATGARRAVEFATGIGISTLYLAAAVRDNGGGVVIGSEILAEKVTVARANLADAGLADFAEIREGDAIQTLADLGGPVDLVLLDGWPTLEPPSLALRVLHVLIPQLRPGALLLDDNLEGDYVAFVRNPANGFRSQRLRLDGGGVELSVYAGVNEND